MSDYRYHVISATVQRVAKEHPEAEPALKKLFPTEFSDFKPGDHVRISGTVSHRGHQEFVVVGKTEAEALRKQWPTVIFPNHVVVINLETGRCHNGAPTMWEKI